MFYLIKISLGLWGDFGKELFCKARHAFVISQTKSENWDGTDFKMRVGTRCSEYREWLLESLWEQLIIGGRQTLFTNRSISGVLNFENLYIWGYWS